MNVVIFTIQEQIAEVKEEIRMREKVYANQVSRGQMGKREAERKIDIMKAVLQNLEKQAPTLFS